ncbi:LOW QUALITY PROTEIN: syntaxin-binding protein 4-like [Menidia menidia]
MEERVKVGSEESRALRSRIQVAEEAQKQARGMEMDYEEVVHLLEAEIAELKTQRVEQPGKREDWEDLRRRLVVLESQLRKSEAAKKVLETSTQKLLSFVESVQDFLLETPGPPKSCSSSGEVKLGPAAPGPPPPPPEGPLDGGGPGPGGPGAESQRPGPPAGGPADLLEGLGEAVWSPAPLPPPPHQPLGLLRNLHETCLFL